MKSRLSKSLAGVTLCFSLFTAGTLITTPQAAFAASQTKSTATATSSKADSIISLGKRYLGVRYKFGASTGNTSAFDCSSFTQYVYGKNGVSLPRSSKQQSQVGTYVPKDQLKPGDLVFFYSPIHHVGIYMGNGKILHTYGSPGVTISDMNTGWWKNNYKTARRVLK
ncbi:C40 family peptidase [Paenibacillus sp. N3.4]|uniref:C40 family peptidase n=1 Tax=Paenibacillus sp. N3.4 TaxID=2603222 RepID=UPI0011CC14B5|nr:NlpC/P60 family protein [Paenibacillus sp. N3.4]